jgi:alkylhydroperoxidase family enzyme
LNFRPRRVSGSGNWDHTLVKYLKTDPANAQLEPQNKAMIGFALKLTREPSSVKQQALETLRQHGFSEEQVEDIVLITCTFNFHGSAG